MPTVHVIQKHQGSRVLRNAIWFVGGISVILFLSITCWLSYLFYNFLTDPKYFSDLLWLDRLPDDSPDASTAHHTGDKAAAGQFWGAVFGGILAGGLTLLAAVIALGGALIQMRREANKEFLEWVVEFNHTFHADKDYAEVRQTLAENRGLFFKWIHKELKEIASATEHRAAKPCQELASAVNTDNMEAPEESDVAVILCPVVRLKSGQETINWNFVRKATDFFRFYEMVLLVAQRLPDFGSQRETFIGGFTWHIKWLLCSWGGSGGMINEVTNQIIVIYYLAFNHFENLCSAALCFILQYRNALQEELAAGNKNLYGQYREEAIQCIKLINSHITSIYEIFEIKNATKLAPEKLLTSYWIKILGHRGAIQ